ncbi:MAG: hypothetical protein AUH88_00145 [Acidobacteria bacterium 13_1_40CM_4_61_5]|nr:MAG: hypothetical protein AUH88_00145 [Acidobacteria bacterium 13_1_40CM_4_61_5]
MVCRQKNRLARRNPFADGPADTAQILIIVSAVFLPQEAPARLRLWSNAGKPQSAAADWH